MEFGGLTKPRRTPAAIEQRVKGCLRALPRTAFAQESLSLLIHHGDAVELVTKLLRIQIGSEMAFVDRGLGTPRD